jgi:hypothetical protein
LLSSTAAAAFFFDFCVPFGFSATACPLLQRQALTIAVLSSPTTVGVGVARFFNDLCATPTADEKGAGCTVLRQRQKRNARKKTMAKEGTMNQA